MTLTVTAGPVPVLGTPSVAPRAATSYPDCLALSGTRFLCLADWRTADSDAFVQRVSLLDATGAVLTAATLPELGTFQPYPSSGSYGPRPYRWVLSATDVLEVNVLQTDDSTPFISRHLSVHDDAVTAGPAVISEDAVTDGQLGTGRVGPRIVPDLEGRCIREPKTGICVAMTGFERPIGDANIRNIFYGFDPDSGLLLSTDTYDNGDYDYESGQWVNTAWNDDFDTTGATLYAKGDGTITLRWLSFYQGTEGTCFSRDYAVTPTGITPLHAPTTPPAGPDAYYAHYNRYDTGHPIWQELFRLGTLSPTFQGADDVLLKMINDYGPPPFPRLFAHTPEPDIGHGDVLNYGYQPRVSVDPASGMGVVVGYADAYDGLNGGWWDMVNAWIVKVPTAVTRPVPLRLGQRDDGLGPGGHPRIGGPGSAPTSAQAITAPRLGQLYY